jgi:hypothetical protein
LDEPAANTVSIDSSGAVLGIGVMLLAFGWAVEFSGRHHTNQLDLSRFGKCEDVCESLARDSFVAKEIRPYWRAATCLDGLALLAVVWQLSGGRFRLLGVIVGIAGTASVAWHGLNWFWTSVFAS